MRIKGIYAERSATIQLGILFLLLLAGTILSTCLTTGAIFFLSNTFKICPQSAWALRGIQLVSAIGTFLVPALITARLCSHSTSQYLSLRMVSDPAIWLLTLTSMVLLSPSINLLGILNQNMELPAFLTSIEEWMRAQENLAEQLTLKILSGDGWAVLGANLIVVALTASITEEFLFRGAFQRIISQGTASPHLAIWLTAFLFSAIHMQFYGFLPRLVIGAYFGYLLLWSRSIWIPVFAHLINNGVAVIGMTSSQLNENMFVTGKVPADELASFSLLAALFLIVFIWNTKQLIRHCERNRS